MMENERSTAINPHEAVEEKVSLSDRFGLWLGFHKCSQDEYLDMVFGYAKRFGLEAPAERSSATRSNGRRRAARGPAARPGNISRNSRDGSARRSICRSVSLSRPPPPRASPPPPPRSTRSGGSRCWSAPASFPGRAYWCASSTSDRWPAPRGAWGSRCLRWRSGRDLRDAAAPRPRHRRLRLAARPSRNRLRRRRRFVPYLAIRHQGRQCLLHWQCRADLRRGRRGLVLPRAAVGAGLAGAGGRAHRLLGDGGHVAAGPIGYGDAVALIAAIAYASYLLFIKQARAGLDGRPPPCCRLRSRPCCC